MKRIQIDLPADVIESLTTTATAHGHKLKPFIEYLLRVQAGHVPPPQVQPVKVRPVKDAAQGDGIAGNPATEVPHSGAYAEALPVAREISTQKRESRNVTAQRQPVQAANEEDAEKEESSATHEQAAKAKKFTKETEVSGIYTDGHTFMTVKGKELIFTDTLFDAKLARW